ncbi:hypothetical protein DFP72DRAFT_1081941 [Ephemerocybe angulata]|uniref:C2H2-type domain-containing protein n=1 Tax=Ephemerocybe angulata TaxID=980116 RepID=A0A8H6H8I1_9AGAR|nr:hypothetical protein DFP72DRAFT_1081941 [Tulosesus angulatus]
MSSAPYQCGDCDKQFSAPRYLEKHQRTCLDAKRRFSEVLQESKGIWEARKKRRLDAGEAENVPRETLSPPPPPPVAGPSYTQDHLNISLAQRRTRRDRDRPPRYRQTPTPPPVAPPPPEPPLPQIEDIRRIRPVPSSRNAHGIRRTYLLPIDERVTHDPDPVLTERDYVAAGLHQIKPSAKKNKAALLAGTTSYGPFPNKSSFEVAEWFWNSNSKSFLEFQKLMGIFKQPSFSFDDVISTDWAKSFHTLGANKDTLPDCEGAWIDDDGWRRTKLEIEVPFHNRMRAPGKEVHEVGEFRYRSIMSIIKEKVTNASDTSFFHYAPYKATWSPNDETPEVELYGEMYTSRAFRDAHEEVQRLPNTAANNGLERVVIGLMFSSDSTTLTHFGDTTLWPCYLMFANESKYRRCEPNKRLCYHVAYFQELPDTFQDQLRDRNKGKLPTDHLFGYCGREVFQKQWSILLDQELRDAMRDGIVLTCPDGVDRCFYPRILTYSADYPEKVIVSGLRKYGIAPCHRCTVSHWDLSNLNAPIDTERKSAQRSEVEQTELMLASRGVIRSGFAVGGKPVNKPLNAISIHPIESPFASLPVPGGFKLLPALVVDLLHEFEIGVWKRLYIHLMRILEAAAPASALLAELDDRFRAIPSFGRDGIRKFGLNASEMKRKAARDYEDLLQCAIPVFDCLLGEPHNTNLMRLLYVCAQWHALAKLRLHNDFTLRLLDYTTTQLGALMRAFSRDTCTQFNTKELKKEAEARGRRDGKGNNSERRPAVLDVFTIKFHYLGDYVENIRQFGTTDSYSTETGELAHRRPKQWYARTDRKEFEGQIGQIERRQARLASIRAEMERVECLDEPESDFSESAALPDPSSECGYTVAENQNDFISLTEVFMTHPGAPVDPYSSNFVPKLKKHLLPRVLQRLGYQEDDLPPDSWQLVILDKNRLYRHKIAKFRYTTYDLRQKVDIVHADTPQCNVVLLNDDYTAESDEHPYRYAKVLGIYHANVSFIGLLPDGSRNFERHRVEFLWVRWFQMAQATSAEFHLDRLCLAPLALRNSLQFVDPSAVLRGIHIVPRFSRGGVEIQDPESHWVKHEKLWKEYFLNRFADRDLFMRFQYGMSVGHEYMRHKFPSPSIPTIPPDFDFCVLPKLASGSEEPNVDIYEEEDPEPEHAPEPVAGASSSGTAISGPADTIAEHIAAQVASRYFDDDRYGIL